MYLFLCFSGGRKGELKFMLKKVDGGSKLKNYQEGKKYYNKGY